MKHLDCEGLRDLDCELALNLLTGAERAAAVTHLEGCPACRAEVSSLAAAADELLELAPVVEPPPGFESRVLRAVAAEQRGRAEASTPVRRRPRARRRVSLAVAAVLVAVAAIGLLLPRDAGPWTTTAAMRTQPGAVVGAATVRAEPPSLVVDLRGWADVLRSYPGADTGVARLRVRYRDAPPTVVTLAVPATASWHTTWKLPPEHDAGDVTSVASVGRDGQVWGSARLT
jgi:hypothetical protein